MTLAIFFLLKYEVKKMNEKAKVYFTLKTQEYTSDVLEKEPKAVIIKNIEETGFIPEHLLDIVNGGLLDKPEELEHIRQAYKNRNKAGGNS